MKTPSCSIDGNNVPLFVFLILEPAERDSKFVYTSFPSAPSLLCAYISYINQNECIKVLYSSHFIHHFFPFFRRSCKILACAHVLQKRFVPSSDARLCHDHSFSVHAAGLYKQSLGAPGTVRMSAVMMAIVPHPEIESILL